MNIKDTLKPLDSPKVIDLVAAAGIDVTTWAKSKRGSVRHPASNPAFCYEWAFVKKGELVAVNLWHEELHEDAGVIFCDINPRKWSEDARQVGTLQANQRSSRLGRAIRMDVALAYAYNHQLQVRVIVGDGERRDLSGPGSEKPSRMERRRLDLEPWFVAEYSHDTGDCRLTRGSVSLFVDQFSTKHALPPEKHEVLGMTWDRDPNVRKAVLIRAQGMCECCGKAGFKTAGGQIYLETHHVIPLSEGGFDNEGNVVAICANDHREAHHGERREIIREWLLAFLAEVSQMKPKQ